MADKKQDIVTFQITLTVEEYRKLHEMKELENLGSINEVYNKALSRHYHYLKNRHKIGELISRMPNFFRRN